MSTISKILNGEETLSECFQDDFSADDLAHFKFAPITSVNVERSFSKYKYLLTDIVVHLLLIPSIKLYDDFDF